MNATDTISHKLRPAEAADAPALLSIYAPYVEHTAVTFEYEVTFFVEEFPV